jgi:hypothetical protein
VDPGGLHPARDCQPFTGAVKGSKSFGRALHRPRNPSRASSLLHGQSILAVLRTKPLTAPAPGGHRRLSGEARQVGGHSLRSDHEPQGSLPGLPGQRPGPWPWVHLHRERAHLHTPRSARATEPGNRKAGQGQQHRCCQYCCLRSRRQPTARDRSGMPAEAAGNYGKCWTICPLLRICESCPPLAPLPGYQVTGRGTPRSGRLSPRQRRSLLSSRCCRRSARTTSTSRRAGGTHRSPGSSGPSPLGPLWTPVQTATPNQTVSIVTFFALRCVMP